MAIMFLSSSSNSLLVLTLVLLAAVSSSLRIDRGPTIVVHVKNELSPGKVLYVRCHCDDHDLGDHYLNVGAEFNWNFHLHAIKRTLWQCYAAPDNNSHAYFHVYDNRTPTFDFDLIFAARDDGVYYRNQDSHEDEYFAKYEPGKLMIH